MKIVLDLQNCVLAVKEVDISFDIEKRPYFDYYAKYPLDDILEEILGKCPNIDLFCETCDTRYNLKKKLLGIKFMVQWTIDETSGSFYQKVSQLKVWLKNDGWEIKTI